MNKNMLKDKSKNKEALKINKCKSLYILKENANCRIRTASNLIQQKQKLSQFDYALQEKNELENILAETPATESNIPKCKKSRNKSCVVFQKQHIRAKGCKLINRRDQQQQTHDQQTSLQKIRRHTYSVQSLYKNIDSLLVQKLQERLQNYTYRIKRKRRQSLNNLQHSQLQNYERHNTQITFQKLVLWTESKMQKFIKQFFQYVSEMPKISDFNKNVRKLDEQRLLMHCLNKYLLQRFKTEKLARQNFINLCYSLQIHLKKAQSQYSRNYRPKSLILISKIRYWNIFDRILINQYDYEDISFYLYIKDLFNHQTALKNSERLFYELNSTALREFLTVLTSNDSQLIAYYLNSFKKSQERGLVDRESILEIILNDFKVKKQHMKKSFKNYEKSNQKSQSFMQQAHYDISFWTEETNQTFIPNAFFQKYQSELERQCLKLVDILCCDQNKQKKQLILSLIISKSVRILHALAQSNNEKLYQQFGCNYPQNNQPKLKKYQTSFFQDIQSLKAHCKEIMEHSLTQQAQLCKVSRFLKQILVCKPLLAKLEVLMDAFQIK